MSLEEEKTNQNEGVSGLLNEDHKAELGKILAFGEKYRKEGEKMRKNFWRRGDRDKYINLIMQYNKNRKRLYMKNLSKEEREILGRLDGVWKDKFIEGYMHDKILYSGDKEKEMKRKQYGYGDWEDGKVIIEEGATLDLISCHIGDVLGEAISQMQLKKGVSLKLEMNDIGDAGAEAISKMELKEGVELDLFGNNIGDEGAKAISKMELKKGVKLDLAWNNIGAVGAEAISRMKLKEGVELNFWHNHIGDAGAEAIMKNLELKEGVKLHLGCPDISKEMKDKLMKWAEGYKKRGINCKVYV